VHDWLHDGKKGKWILILDNIDDARFLLDVQLGIQGQTGGSENRSSKSLREYIPQSPNGSILITSRSREVALKLVEPSDIIAVEPMDEVHALSLFEKKLGKQDKSQNVAELAVALEFMPLAMAQAAAFISQRAPRCSVQQYLEEFRKSDRKKTSLLDYEGGQLRRDREAKNSIIITWQISFDHMLETRPSAADLLSLMSFFDRQGIPEALLRSRTERRNSQQDQRGNNDSEEDEDSKSQCSVSDRFEDDILALRNYSFIFVNADSTTFEMHGLVQLATRKWLDVNGRLERWKLQYIKNLYAVFPTGAPENWSKCQALFPHAQSVVGQKPVARSSLREWAGILHNAAWYIGAKGNYIEAESLSQKATRTLKRVLGGEHPDTLTSMANLAATYMYQGRWKEAEELQAKELEISRRLLGAEHPDSLISIANLASTYMYQGRWKEAEELEVQVMETRKRVLSVEHPDTLISMANLASTYSNTGRWKEAEELEVPVMKTRKRVIGVEHPSTLTSMNNLAFIWKEQGRVSEAIKLMKECAQLRTLVLGADHPYTLSSCTVLTSWQTEGLEVIALAANASSTNNIAS
jgi:tetratricopeptide (TPR) repeat protein